MNFFLKNDFIILVFFEVNPHSLWNVILNSGGNDNFIWLSKKLSVRLLSKMTVYIYPEDGSINWRFSEKEVLGKLGIFSGKY